MRRTENMDGICTKNYIIHPFIEVLKNILYLGGVHSGVFMVFDDSGKRIEYLINKCAKYGVVLRHVAADQHMTTCNDILCPPRLV